MPLSDVSAVNTTFNKAASDGPVSPQTFINALDRALTRLDQGNLSKQQVETLEKATRSPAEKALWSRALDGMSPGQTLNKNGLVTILAREGYDDYNRLANDAAKIKNGPQVLEALNKELGPATASAGNVLARHGISDPAIAPAIAMEGVALQVASMAPAAPSGAPQQKSAPIISSPAMRA